MKTKHRLEANTKIPI